MSDGTSDTDYNNPEPESMFPVSGTTTPSGASFMPQVVGCDVVEVSYTWDAQGEEERNVTEEMPLAETRRYLSDVLNIGSGTQPDEKFYNTVYWTDAQDKGGEPTSLPNPNRVGVDGEIGVDITYEGGLLELNIEFDTEYSNMMGLEEEPEGVLRVSCNKLTKDEESKLENLRKLLN